MKPLEGYRVIEAAQMISAPMAGMILAEQGADVVKVEMADGVGDRRADDPRYATLELREQNADALSAEFSVAIAQLSTEECLTRMRGNDVAGAAVASLDEVHELPQVVHNGSLVVHDAGPAGLVREALLPVGWRDTGRTISGPAAALGEHTETVLRELGCDDHHIRELADAGVLGPTQGAHP